MVVASHDFNLAEINRLSYIYIYIIKIHFNSENKNILIKYVIEYMNCI